LSVGPDDSLHEPAAALRRRLERGATVSEAVDSWSDDIADARPGGAELLIAFATVVGAAAELGGSVSIPLERFAVSMRRRVSDELERSAQSAQARLSARVLTTVPVAMLALLLATDDDVRAVLGEPAGAAAIGVGLALNATGGWWMRRVVAGVERGGR
jgi:tight adherence protein B